MSSWGMSVFTIQEIQLPERVEQETLEGSEDEWTGREDVIKGRKDTPT